MASESTDTSNGIPIHAPPLPSSRRASLQPPISTRADSSDSGLPMRHPRPLTAAEIHLELEQEQEAIVNRLTRELTQLRQHSASVASTTSNSSTAPVNFISDTGDFANHGSTYPILTRTERSGSNASAAAAQLPNIPGTSRYDELAQQRVELEAAKRENDRLRDRVKELEAKLRERRSSLSTTPST